MKIDLLTILLSSGVLAAIITSIINLISIRTTNKRLLLIEELKNDNAINTFRYTKLFDLNAELNNLPDVDYTMLDNHEGKLVWSKDKVIKVVGESTNRFSMFIKIYNKSKPLFDENIISELQNLINSERAISNELVEILYAGREGNSDISNLMAIRVELEKKLQESIVIQLKALIKA